MANLNPAEVQPCVGVYYKPEFAMEDIAAGEREFCLELLNDLGYRCVSGCTGSRNATVDDLFREAARDTLALSSNFITEPFFVGPNPHIETGVGIWTAT